MPTKEEIHRENTIRMRHFNNEAAKNLYWMRNPKIPRTPRIIGPDGIERPYVFPVPRIERPPTDQNPDPVGDGPDEFNYYAVNGPDYHTVGSIYNSRQGKVFVLVETPDSEGVMDKRWIQVA